MLIMALILTLGGGAVYNYLTVPRLCAEVAAQKGLDERKWYANGLFFSALALLYLRCDLAQEDRELRVRVDKVLIIEGLLTGWTLGLVICLRYFGY